MDIKQDKDTRQEYSKRKNYFVTKLLIRIYSTPIGILSLQLLYTFFPFYFKIDVAHSLKNSHKGQSIQDWNILSILLKDFTIKNHYRLKLYFSGFTNVKLYKCKLYDISK